MFILCKFFGNIGEKYAEKYLKSCGYKIIARQRRLKFVEIDILARRGKTLYVFEVKSVSQGNTQYSAFNPVYRVDQRKRKKMTYFAEYYLNKHPEYDGVAIGIIIVSLADDLDYPEIEIVWV